MIAPYNTGNGKLRAVWVLGFSLGLFACVSNQSVKVGLDQVENYASLFTGKRLGIITNHTARTSDSVHISEVFLEMDDVQVSAFFGPEHGIRGHAEAGEHVASDLDPTSNIPVYSVYGKTRKPSPEMLANVDVLVFDMQDVGARFYTYIWTMALAMEAAAENNIPFVVLDRPNLITGSAVEGPLLEDDFSSFVGMYPIPVRHGMTVGELAQLFNAEGWLANSIQADLHVVPLSNWSRSAWYDETGLQFIRTSPNIPDLTTATVYPGTCLIEGTNVSEGRGTETPFQLIGAPWIDGEELAVRMNSLNLAGINFEAAEFTPISIPGASLHPKHKNVLCRGIRITLTNRDTFQPFVTGVHIVKKIQELYPDSLNWRESHFDRLAGTDQLRLSILAGQPLEPLFETWQLSNNEFNQIRRKYLLYE